jgi:NADPH:quinone reductase-like Zn-dependent oxidoreductase
MRAIRFDDYGPVEALHLAEVDKPVPGPGELLVRVAAAGVNPADGKWRQGMFKSFIPIALPHVPGYDIAGTVEAVGEDVAGWHVGDRVVGLLGNTTHGGYAEFAAAEAHACARVPESLDLAVAAALPVAGLTGAQMIEEQIRPAAGETVLVTGAVGAVGRFIVHAALAEGAKVVAAVRPAQADEARSLGASEVIALDQEVSGMTFDHVADTVGGPAVAKLCRQLRPGGRICTAATDPIDPEGLAAEPVFIFLYQDGARLQRIVDEIAAGGLPVPIARRMPLARAAEAQRLTAAGGLGGKIILEP